MAAFDFGTEFQEFGPGGPEFTEYGPAGEFEGNPAEYLHAKVTESAEQAHNAVFRVNPQTLRPGMVCLVCDLGIEVDDLLEATNRWMKHWVNEH